MRTTPLRLGFIGDGGISRDVRRDLAETDCARFEIVGVLSRTENDATLCSVEEMLAHQPDVIVECAGHQAMHEHAEPLLAAGKTLVVASIGALADAELLDRLTATAAAAGGKLVLASGALAGIDALGAARVGGLSRVRYVGRKPPAAWAGSPAAKLVDLDTVTQPLTFFRGSAREAALKFPKNSNVAATVALAGIGFDDTEVELVADPTTSQNVHELMFEGRDGRVEIRIANEPSRANPKTSALTAHSITRLLRGMVSPLVV